MGVLSRVCGVDGGVERSRRDFGESGGEGSLVKWDA